MGKSFSPQGRETAAGAKHADIKETYFIPSHCSLWPKRLPEFQSVMEQYRTQLSTMAASLMTYVAEYIC